MTQAPVRRRLDPAERRAQILETALQLFENQPFQSVSLRQIARACGVNIALLYHYFDSKEDLVRDSLLYAVESFTTAFDACEPPKDQPLGEASVWLFAAISSIPMLVRMVRLMSDYGLQSDSDPRAHRIVEDFYTRERTTFERAFQKGTTEGRFRPLDPARIVSHYMV